MATSKEMIQLEEISIGIYTNLNFIEWYFNLLQEIENNTDVLEKYRAFVASMINVYSENIVLLFNSVLDADQRTASLYTLANKVENEDRKKMLIAELDAIKETDNWKFVRNNLVAHLNAKEAFFGSHRKFYIDPSYKKLPEMLDALQKILISLKEELKIDRWAGYIPGNIAGSFKEMIDDLKS